jgi:hypothetical protein
MKESNLNTVWKLVTSGGSYEDRWESTYLYSSRQQALMAIQTTEFEGYTDPKRTACLSCIELNTNRIISQEVVSINITDALWELMYEDSILDIGDYSDCLTKKFQEDYAWDRHNVGLDNISDEEIEEILYHGDEYRDYCGHEIY